TLNELLNQAHLQWHGIDLNRPDWREDSHSISFTVGSLRGRFTLHAMLNAYWEPLAFELPSVGEKGSREWRRWIDTALPSPEDICAWEDTHRVQRLKYVVEPRSLAILVKTTPSRSQPRRQPPTAARKDNIVA